MALVSAIINRSLRILKAIDVASATPAIDSQRAMVALNAMLMRWEANGLALGWSPQTAVDDTIPIPDEAEEAVAYNLAVKLGPEYPQPSNWEEIKQIARDGLVELRRDRITEAPLTLQVAVPLGRGGRGFNIPALLSASWDD